jgi:hypothetical protein
MRHTPKLILLGGALAAAALLNLPARAQTTGAAEQFKATVSSSGATSQEPGSTVGCKRPEEAREAKVIDFDPSASVARLAVNLGSGRFTLVTIKTWDRPQDPRPLNPVLEAAKITQGKLQFFSRQLTTDPASAPDEFLIMTEMGGGYVCWANPSWLMETQGSPVANAPASATPPTSTSAPSTNAQTAPAQGPLGTTPLEPGLRRTSPVRRGTTQEPPTQ